jgi:uncharacterized protein (TIGR00730 family)
MPDRPHVCVFCGSARGARPSYADAGRRLGGALARAGLGLVYGGGRVGIMGVVADAVLAEGGRAVGVIPQALAAKELAHDGLTELHVVAGMHERKALMAARSAGFLTLPGGIGTYEEFFEILTWGALGLHRKPVGLLNVEGYFDPLIALLDHAVGERFTRAGHVAPLLVSHDPEAVARDLLAHVPPPVGRRWIGPDET